MDEQESPEPMPRASWRPKVVAQQASPQPSGGGGAGEGSRRLRTRLNTAGDSAAPAEAAEQNEGKDKDKGKKRATEDKDKDKDKGARTRRGGRRARGGAAATDKKLTTKDPMLRSLLLTISKLSLHTAQQTRYNRAATQDVVLGPLTHPVIKGIDDELRNYLAQVAKWRNEEIEDHPGNPAATLYVAMIEALLTQDIGALNKKTLEEHLTQLNREPQPQQAIELVVPFMRIDSATEQGQKKVAIAMRQSAARPAVLAAIVQCGLIHCTGPARPGWMETELSEWVVALSQ